MKKRVLLFLVSILLVNIISAAYDCSGTISTEKSIIDVGAIESINGVKIALLDSSMGKSAEILIDARELVLTNESSSVNITLVSGNHEINLTSIVNGFVWMKIDGNEGKVEEKRVEEIGGLQVYVSSLQGTYPGEDAEAKLFVGEKYLFLYEANPADIQTIGRIKYLFEISSSSASRAMIEVKKCSGGDFIEINESIELVPVDSDLDDSLLQNESVQNESLSEENTTIGNLTDLEGLQDKSFAQAIPYIIILIVIIIMVILIVLFILYLKYKKNDEVVSEDTEVKASEV